MLLLNLFLFGCSQLIHANHWKNERHLERGTFSWKKKECFSVRLAASDLKSSYIFLHWDTCSAAGLPASPNRDGASGASILSWSTFIESTTSCTRQSLSSLLAANSMLIQIHNGCGKSLCCIGTTRLWKSKAEIEELHRIGRGSEWGFTSRQMFSPPDMIWGFPSLRQIPSFCSSCSLP